MEKILVVIDEVQNLFFNDDIKKFTDSIGKLTEKIANIVNLIDENKLTTLNNIIYYLNIALNNKDYLLYSDILEYELKPFIKGLIV